MFLLLFFLATLSHEPLRVGGDVKTPVVIKRVAPVFPECKPEEISGLVIFDIVIDENGDVLSAEAIEHVKPCVEKGVSAALMQWKFKPGTLHGEPVPVIFTVAVKVGVK